MTNWTHNGKLVTTVPDGIIGFVYLITDKYNNKKYIGKKLAVTTKKMPPLKGKTRKRHKRVDTDWQSYWGSNDKLNAEVALRGEHWFTREILHWCENKNQMSYWEAREQFNRNVLLDNTYYNGIIHCRVSARGL